MVKYIIWAIVFYLLIRFIFNFVVPLVRAGRQMRNQMKDFQEKMNQQQQQSHFQNNANAYQAKQKEHMKRSKEDYIDFEEIKE